MQKPLTDEEIWGDPHPAADYIVECPLRAADGTCPIHCNVCGLWLREMNAPVGPHHLRIEGT